MDDFEAPLHTSAPGGPFPGVVRHAPVSVDADRDFEDLYREHAGRLWRAVFAYAGDGEVASDAVSEAFAQCLARGSAVRSPGRWVWKAAFRIAAGEMKERRVRSVPLQDQAVDMDPAAAQFVSLLAGLSPRQRACLILRYYGGYRPAEIGRILGLTAATVRVHLSQGHRRLREQLKDQDA